MSNVYFSCDDEERTEFDLLMIINDKKKKNFSAAATSMLSGSR